jgi:hypothetical protein
MNFENFLPVTGVRQINKMNVRKSPDAELLRLQIAHVVGGRKNQYVAVVKILTGQKKARAERVRRRG